ncbi:MAG: hypothetical protein KF873_12950 [Gemmataceae bacterium]|nr:hypothetical protein [Gemmataceae bacterium]
MFGFGQGRKTLPPATGERTKLLGLDMTASRIRGLAVAGGHTNPVSLDRTTDELPLFINLEPRVPDVGRSGYAAARKHPHLVCSNFLPQLGQTREWRGTRATLTPESALAAAFEKIRPAVLAEADAAAIALPSYLVAPQVKALREIAAKAKFPAIGTASAPLAVAAHRAKLVLKPRKPSSAPNPEWVVPIRPQDAGPGEIVFVDADEFALSAAVVSIQPAEARLLSLAAWPKLSMKVWKDRLIDSLSDRCVRLCRRDPRDSADAEQSLFEQLDAALEKVRQAQPVTLVLRGEKWYQDLVQQPTDFDSHCAPLIKSAAENLREIVANAGAAAPPRAVWLTDSAAKLPGLAAAIFQNASERTEVAVLPPDAVTEAAAALHARWQADRLPRVHLDGIIGLEIATKPKFEPRSQKSV